MAEKLSVTPSGWIEELVHKIIADPEKNTLQNQAGDRAFENPLVGFSSGDDPLYLDYKDHVGPFHWTPLEIFRLSFPEIKAHADELTVISWILPHIEATKRDNRRETQYPAQRWARGKNYGEQVNVQLRKYLVDVLQQKGVAAVAPTLASQFSRKMSDKYGFASTWSERHAAYASGLGTFGLSEGLITPRGKAMRAGSVIARTRIAPTPRAYSDHRAYCLFHTRGICGKCIQRCPADAISESGHDKAACRRYLHETTAGHIKSQYKFDGKSCGLCQTAVPCESKIPVPADVDAD